MKKEPRNYRPSLLRQSLKKRSQKVLRDCLFRLQTATLEKEYERHSELAQRYEKEGNEKF